MKKLLFIFLAIGLLLTACSNKSEPVVSETPVVVEPKPLPEPVLEEPDPEPIKEGKPSPLSGIYASDDIISGRVVAVMFDNHPRARWQAGIKDAEVVYEFPVEAPYTRYLGLYLINSPESIGPIRSSRPYFVTKAYEFDAIYVRVGGSEQAKGDIKALGIADIDGLTSSSAVFWRNSSKKAPNNLYSSMKVIRETAESRGYNLTGSYEGFKFYEEDTKIDGFTANSILINYMSNNTTKYIFNTDTGLYARQKDGKDHIDESDNSQISAKNIIIQEANVKVIDSEGRLSIDIVGEGQGKYITNGVGLDIKWVKESRKATTKYYDKNGEEIILNPGQTWIQIVDINPSIVIE